MPNMEARRAALTYKRPSTAISFFAIWDGERAVAIGAAVVRLSSGKETRAGVSEASGASLHAGEVEASVAIGLTSRRASRAVRRFLEHP